MVDKSAAILLHHFRYSDSGIITHFYTEKFGRLAVMIKGAGSRKPGKNRICLQPLAVTELVLSIREQREIQTLRDFSVIYTPSDIYGNPVKSSIAMFIGEVLSAVLKEESPQPELYAYLYESVKYFDRCRTGFTNFHIGFLAGLCGYLGIEPSRRTDPEHSVFDYTNGCFVTVPPAHGNYAGMDISDLLARIFGSSWEEMISMPLNGQTRNDLLAALLAYYYSHFPSMKKIRSLEVLRIVFQPLPHINNP